MRHHPNRPAPERVRALAAKGLSDTEIGDLHGVTRGTIAGMRHHHGIPTSGKPGAHHGEMHWSQRQVVAERERYEAEVVALAASEVAWQAALAGRLYVDSDRAAPPQAFQAPRRPQIGSTGQSSMGWAG